MMSSKTSGAIDSKEERLDRKHASNCYHCGLPVPAGSDYQVRIKGRLRPMCCKGCEAVATAIVEARLEDFYRYRTENPPQGEELVPDSLRKMKVYDNPQVQRSFVSKDEGTRRAASLILEGITCAACVWLNEQHIRSLPGIIEMQVNYTTQRARVSWDEQQIKLSDILESIAQIGYQAHPYDPDRQQRLLENERRERLKRLGLAGALGMQVMMIAVALYFGDWTGMEAKYRTFFHWASLVLTLPVVTYSAQPFFASAWRDLRALRAGMDVPVSLGILGAFAASVWNTITGQGHVYFDSVVMFVFFLLTARFFELAGRRRSAEATERMARMTPSVATRIESRQGTLIEQAVAAGSPELSGDGPSPAIANRNDSQGGDGRTPVNPAAAEGDAAAVNVTAALDAVEAADAPAGSEPAPVIADRAGGPAETGFGFTMSEDAVPLEVADLDEASGGGLDLAEFVIQAAVFGDDDGAIRIPWAPENTTAKGKRAAPDLADRPQKPDGRADRARGSGGTLPASPAGSAGNDAREGKSASSSESRLAALHDIDNDTGARAADPADPAPVAGNAADYRYVGPDLRIPIIDEDDIPPVRAAYEYEAAEPTGAESDAAVRSGEEATGEKTALPPVVAQPAIRAAESLERAREPGRRADDPD